MPIPNDEFFRDLQAMRRDWLLGGGQVPGRGQPPREAPRAIYVVNESGEEVPAFGVMRVLGVEDRTSNERFNYLRIAKPNGSGSAHVINGPRPLPAIAPGVTGRGIAFRNGEALYDAADGTPAAGETWGPGDDWKLHKDEPGFEILGGANASSGTVYVWGQQPSSIVKAVADEEIAVNGSGTVSVWRGGIDSGIDVEAHLNWMHGDEKVSSGKEVLIRWFSDENKWIIIGAECE